MKLDRIRRTLVQWRGRWGTRTRAPSALNQRLEGHRWGDSKKNCAPENNQHIWLLIICIFFFLFYFILFFWGGGVELFWLVSCAEDWAGWLPHSWW